LQRQLDKKIKIANAKKQVLADKKKVEDLMKKIKTMK
jgi:hypothetical protein